MHSVPLVRAASFVCIARSTGCMVYKMLTGRMPWIPARKCLQKPLSTSGPTWKNISEQAKSLVEDLLHTDQTFRADVDQATHHPWFDGMEHCAMMPTSAPGGKLAGRLSPSSSPKEQSPILDAALGERGIAVSAEPWGKVHEPFDNKIVPSKVRDEM